MNRRKILLIIVDLVSFFASFVLLLGFFPSGVESLTLVQRLLHGAIMLACVFGCRFVLRVYSRVWRYANASEYLRVVMADFFGGCLYLGINYIVMPWQLTFVRSVSLISLSALATLSARFAYQYLSSRRNRPVAQNGLDSNKINVAIVGAGRVGVLLAEELLLNPHAHYTPYCFFDKDPHKIGSLVMGLKVYREDDSVVERIREMPIQEIVIALPNLDADQKKILYELYKKTGCHVKLYDYPFGEGGREESKRTLRDFKIEDLLFRDAVTFDEPLTKQFYYGKTILITGAGGSIGSELCRQVAKMNPRKLIILDIYENNAYDICQELVRRYGSKLDVVIEIASVRDAVQIDCVFAKYRPDVVFHAAAHKHVHLMEHNCIEAVKNNIFGTLNVVNAAERYGVRRFLLISTDKAVNPTNVMGASKRLCEMIVQSRRDSKTDFVAVRFGNVLGSNGSVIPLFKRQIENGGPITITDKRIIRYFMTIPEAVQLVLQTGAMAGKSEIYVLDMGRPVKILDLAENMIRLSGLTPYRDIDIVEVGLRPGEKLYEELLIKTESLDQTDNKMIFIERDQPLSREEIAEKLDILQNALTFAKEQIHQAEALTIGNETVRSALKRVVPTFQDAEEINEKASESEEMKKVERFDSKNLGMEELAVNRIS